MFCPIGYRSAAELWVEYQQAQFAQTYERATKFYINPKKSIALTRGSPKDICEYLFFRSLAAVGVYLASPQGNIIRLFVNTDNETNNIFHSLLPLGSLEQKILMDYRSKNGPAKDAPVQIYGFQEWPHEAANRQVWIEKYPVCDFDDLISARDKWSAIRHHTLLKFLVRPSYTVSPVVQPWAIEDSQSPLIAPVIQNYLGWSVCIDEESYREAWPKYLRGEHDFFHNAASVSERPQGIGRPRLDRAHAAFAAIGFDKGDLSWAQVRAKIKRETGEGPSAKTLRNWRDEHLRKS